jgi:hypothetical protein
MTGPGPSPDVGLGAHTPMELYNIYHTIGDTGSAEYSPYASAAVDAYMDEALACGDLEESYTLWQKAQWDGVTGVTVKGTAPGCGWSTSTTCTGSGTVCSGGAEDPSPRPRLVHRQQRGRLVLGLRAILSGRGSDAR